MWYTSERFVHFKPPPPSPPNPFVADPLITHVFVMLLGEKSEGTSEAGCLRTSLGFEICTGFRIQHNTPNECFILPYGLSRKPLSTTTQVGYLLASTHSQLYRPYIKHSCSVF